MSTEKRDDAAPQATVESLLEDLRSVMRGAESLLQATEGTVSENIAEIRAGAETGAREAAQSAHRYVRENPWTAVAVAAGIGYLLGQLGRRR